MKTASPGLLEVPVVRVNAGGNATPDPPSVGDVTGSLVTSWALLRRAHGDARECVDMIDSRAACVHATTDHFRIPNVGEVTIFRRIGDCTRILLILLNDNSKLN